MSSRGRGRGWESKVSNRGFAPPIPPGLRGRAIGMYYRNLHKKRTENKDQNNTPKVKKPKFQTIKLNLPAPVLNALRSNLSVIKNCAKRSNIELSLPNFEAKIGKNPFHDYDDKTASTSEEVSLKNEVIDDKEKNFDVSNQSEDIKNEIKTEASTSQEVIVKKEINNDKDILTNHSEDENMECSNTEADETKPKITNDIEKRILSFRGAGDYKYSYEDIISGTFEEKLDEKIAKGITITFVNEETNNLNQKIFDEHQKAIASKAYNKMMEFRRKLPAYQKREEILDVVTNNQVIVISGETGCGKSTQVPQMILDDAITKKQGALVKILVTQPRRIAAISLASRVAQERAENVGDSVGYVIRLEKVDCRPRGSITFCTTGVLLADLEVDQGLTNYSHIILDEVHERDSHIDISMCMLKQVLKKRPDLKIILMSATLDADKLSTYFDNCPMLHIEGLAYPVEDIYLEDILSFTKFHLPEDCKKKSKKHQRWQHNQGNVMENEIKYRAEMSSWIESNKKRLDRHVYETLLDYRIEALNIDLIVELLIYICKGPPGAILVFVPGIGDITGILRKMEETQKFPQSRYEIHPLHSKLPTLEQRRIFERPPEHIRKIIIATNIAETSITIDDIVYVVDSGKIKLNGLNVEQNFSTLNTQWVSQANLRQRRGRAGRCQPGICYHLISSYRASKLEERLLPEIQRSNLLETVLEIKKLRLGKAENALNMMPEPPALSTVQWAVQHLRQSGALDADESLTPLGWHLARLPVHPAAGKLLLLAALFGCLDRAASVAAVWGFKDPFMLVIGKEQQVDQMKRRLAMGEPSDHVAMSQALLEWESINSYRSKRNFAYDHFLSNNTLELLSQMKNQLADGLKQMGFLPSGDVRASWENRNCNNLSLFKAIVAAALYPNIGTVKWRRNMNKPVRVTTPDNGKVTIHPSSVMSPNRNVRSFVQPLCANPGANWLVYWLKQKTTDLFLIDVTLVYSLPLLFFGEMRITEAADISECYWHVTNIVVVCKKETARLLHELRCLLDQVLASKVMVSSQHTYRHSEFEERVLTAVMELITAQDEKAEYLGDYSESDHSEAETSY